MLTANASTRPLRSGRLDSWSCSDWFALHHSRALWLATSAMVSYQEVRRDTRGSYRHFNEDLIRCSAAEASSLLCGFCFSSGTGIPRQHRQVTSIIQPGLPYILSIQVLMGCTPSAYQFQGRAVHSSFFALIDLLSSSLHYALTPQQWVSMIDLFPRFSPRTSI